MSAARLSSSLAALSRTAAARTARTAPRRLSLRPLPRQPLITRYSSSSAAAPAAASESASTPTSTSTSPPAELTPPPHLSPAELSVYTTLASALAPASLAVQDISGGCGSMFGIEVASAAFAGLSVLKQQRMVNALLKAQMEAEDWHGVQIRTSVA